MPEPVVQNIKGGGSAVNVKAMDDANFELLYQVDSESMGTPTVYDLGRDQEDRHLRQRLADQAHAVVTDCRRFSTIATPSSAAPAISQPTTAIEPAGMIASDALRCCTRTRSGSFLSYST